MSGAEVVSVVGLIASVITIIESSRQLYDAATNAKGLHKAFRAVAVKIPLVLEILRKCKGAQERADEEYQMTTDATRKLELERSAEATSPVMLACEQNVRKLQGIFARVVPGEQATMLQRYSKAAQTVMIGKKDKVESLMKDILEQLQLLQVDRFFKSIVEEKSADLTAALHQLSIVPVSLPDEDGGDISNAQNAEETPPPLTTVPFLPNVDFVERAEFQELEHKLSGSGRRVVLTGLGGIGKSQFAIEYCYRMREKSPEMWTFWIHASTAARFDQEVRKLADDVKIPGRSHKDADCFQLVRSWLNDSRRTWLIVLDNADDADFLFEAPMLSNSGNSGNSMLLRIDYLPVCSHGSILITTRWQSIARRLVDQCNIISLQPNEDHATQLLRKKLGQLADATSVQKLAANLEHMPLAITQAAAYINKRAPRCTVEDYLRKLESSDKSKSSLLKVHYDELRRDRLEAKNAILLTWQISFEHLHRTRRSAADLLSLMSFFDCQGIPECLVRNLDERQQDTLTGADEENSNASDTESSSDDAFETDIDTLRDYSFISVSPAGTIFEMHRLVQLAAKMWLNENGEYNSREAHSLHMLKTAFPYPHFHWWGLCGKLYPHARLALLSKASERNTQINLVSILYHASVFAGEQGWYAESEVMIRRSLRLQQDIAGDEHPETWKCLSVLADMLRRQGNYSDSEELNRHVLMKWKSQSDGDTADVLVSMNNLALVLTDQAKYGEAEDMYRSSVERSERDLGKDHSLTLTSMNNLALVLREQGKYSESELIQRLVTQGEIRAVGLEHPHTLTSLNGLALVLSVQGKHDEAAQIYPEEVKLSEKILGPEHPLTLTSMGNLGQALVDNGKYIDAERMHRIVVEAQERTLGKEHPTTLVALNNLALAVSGQGKHREAEEILRGVVKVSQRVLGKEHHSTLINMTNLASEVRLLGNHSEAEQLHLAVLKIEERVLGKEHLDTVESMADRAATLIEHGKYEEAEQLYRVVVQVMENVSGKEHVSTLKGMNNLALALYYQGKYDEAEPIHRTALEISEKVMGLKHRNTLISLLNISVLLLRTDHMAEAEIYARRAFRDSMSTLGETNPFTQQCRARLANVWRWRKRSEAEIESLFIAALCEDEIDAVPTRSSIDTSVQNHNGVLDDDRVDLSSMKDTDIATETETEEVRRKEEPMIAS